MATLYITEFSGIGNQTERVQAPRAPTASQEVAVGVASASSSTFNASTTLVRLFADVPCFVSFGDAPDAETDTRIALAAESVEYVCVSLSSGQKVAVVERTLPA